jgi:tetratricopeptide (TPR) repeat protein
MSATRLSAREMAPALLIVGVVAAASLFARSQTAEGAGASGRAAAGAIAGPATAAHEAVGVEMPGGAGDVAALFTGRVDALRAQLAAAPDDRALILQLARLLHDGHRAADAVPLYRKAISLDPEDPQPYYDLASVHGDLEEWDAAADDLMERLDQNPHDVVALYDLGAVRANQGRTEEARRLLAEARETTSDGATLARISQALSRLKAP